MTRFDHDPRQPRKVVLRRAQPEAAEQAALIYWAKLNETKCPALKMLFAIPNGGRRDARTGAMLKRQGVKPGVPDLFLAVPSKFYFSGNTRNYGLFIEMKAPGVKKVGSEWQAWWHRELAFNRYRIAVCDSSTEAAQAICDYLDVKLPI